MTIRPLRVMVVQDNALVAERLAQEIRACGEIVVGPFADIEEAMPLVGTVQAAILDVQVQEQSVFSMADELMQGNIPFVFLTGRDGSVIPSRFAGHRAFPAPRHAAPMLHELRRQRRRPVARQDEQQDDLRAVVVEMMRHSHAVMPDASSAERLVEAVLLQAVAQTVERPAPALIRPWLMVLMAEEIRKRRARYLH